MITSISQNSFHGSIIIEKPQGAETTLIFHDKDRFELFRTMANVSHEHYKQTGNKVPAIKAVRCLNSLIDYCAPPRAPSETISNIGLLEAKLIVEQGID